MKKLLVKLLVLSIVAMGLVGCGTTNTESTKNTESISDEAESGESDEEKIVVRIGTQPGDILNNIAQAKGFFEEEGVDVDLQVFSYGPPIVEALTAGDLDVGFLGDQPAFSAISSGVDIEIINKYKASEKLHGLIARDDSGIETLADLKGKTVSVPVGSNAQPLLYIYLEAAGLTDSDIEIVNLGNADAATSLIAGDIDASVVWEPRFRNVATEENGIHIVEYAEGYKSYVSITISRKAFGEENPNEIAKLQRAWNKAAVWAAENVDEAAQIIYDVDGTDKEATKVVLENADITVNLTEDDIRALEDGEKQSFKFDLIQNDFNVRDYINTSYLELAGLR